LRANRVARLLEIPGVDQAPDLAHVPAISTVVTWVDHDDVTLQRQDWLGGARSGRP
jgi:hypothetical protein